MSKFAPLADFQRNTSKGYRLLPFRFERLNADRYVATNAVGEFTILQDDALRAFTEHRLPSDSTEYATLKSKHFLLDDDSDVAIELLALKARTKLERMSNFTALHMFVVTLRCEHSCPYCQVSRKNDDKRQFDMTPEIASKALDLVFRSPSPSLKIEFQGGEPMLNFPMIQYIVAGALERNATAQRNLGFVVATNLAVVTDDILAFCREHRIHISTSLDGPKDLHNRNRPRPGNDSYERTIDGIRRVREALGRDEVSALMTSTEASLARVKEIVDEYVANSFSGIFLRPLSPYGFALKTKWYRKYNAEKWLPFYFEGIDYIIEINRAGFHFTEFYAATVLAKMLTPFQPGFVDLMSPAGIGIGALLYNYDGGVYASDESRMLAEMGDHTFRLGDVANTYAELLLSDALLDPLEASFANSVPMCSTCAFESYCGADPVYHHATQGDFVGRKPTSDFCHRNMSVFKGLIQRMEADDFTRELFTRWANR
jgi:His-Xaa-Ser system radical SAM maturase HxsB